MSKGINFTPFLPAESTLQPLRPTLTEAFDVLTTLDGILETHLGFVRECVSHAFVIVVATQRCVNNVASYTKTA